MRGFSRFSLPGCRGFKHLEAQFAHCRVAAGRDLHLDAGGNIVKVMQTFDAAADEFMR